MATFEKNSAAFGSNNQYSLRIVVTEDSQSIANNTTTITVKMYTVSTQQNGAYNLDNNNTVKLNVNGTQVISSSKADLDFRNTSSSPSPHLITYESSGVNYNVSYTTTVTHSSDGTKDITVGGSIYYNSSSASSLSKGTYPASTWTETISLTRIPRASTVSATNVSIGNPSTITITKADKSFYHTLTFAFSGQSTRTQNVTHSPDSLTETYSGTNSTYAGSTIPNAKTGTCTVTCTTYSDSGRTNAIGTSSTSFTVSAQNNLAVSSVTVKATELPWNSSGGALIIKGKSTARVTFNCSPSTGATMKTATITYSGGSKSYTFSSGTTSGFVDIPNAVVGSYSVVATDSRGYSNAQAVTTTVPVRDYIEPSVSLSFSEDNITDTTRRIKTIVTGTATPTILKEDNSTYTNTLTIMFEGHYYPDGTWSSPTTVTDATFSGNSYTKNFYTNNVVLDRSLEVRITVHDTITGNKVVYGRTSANEPAWGWDKSTFSHNTNVVFDNGDQLTERSIRYKNATDSTYYHNTTIYGGNPESQTSLGIWDTARQQSVLLYSTQTNLLSLMNSGTSLDGDVQILGNSMKGLFADAFRRRTSLSTEDLNDCTLPGVYIQHVSQNATTARHYPVGNYAGYLEVFPSPTYARYKLQRFTTYDSNYVYIRDYYGSSDSAAAWSEWKRIFPTDVIVWGSADAVPDLNADSLKVRGYRIYDNVYDNSSLITTKNFPSNNSGFLECFYDSSVSTRYIQRYTTYNSSAVYIRHYYNSTWSAWKKIFPVVYSGTDPTTTGIHTATVSADFNSSGVASVTVSGVTTSSHVIAQRVATASQTGSSWSVAAAVPTAANTVRLVQSSMTTASSVSINIIWW